MTNNINVLDEAYELGEKIAINLTNQEVNASASEGLTTLINKINCISPQNAYKFVCNNQITKNTTYIYPNYDIVNDQIIEFRFKSPLPNHIQFGIGNTSTNDIIFEKNGTTINIYRNTNANKYRVQSYSYFQTFLNSTNPSFFIKRETYTPGSGVDKLMRVSNDGTTYPDWWQCGKTGNKIKIITYSNDPCILDVIVRYSPI